MLASEGREGSSEGDGQLPVSRFTCVKTECPSAVASNPINNTGPPLCAWGVTFRLVGFETVVTATESMLTELPLYFASELAAE